MVSEVHRVGVVRRDVGTDQGDHDDEEGDKEGDRLEGMGAEALGDSRRPSLAAHLTRRDTADRPVDE